MSHILIACIVETPMICTLPKSQRAQKHNKVHLDEKSIPGSDQGLMSDGIFIFILLGIISSWVRLISISISPAEVS